MRHFSGKCCRFYLVLFYFCLTLSFLFGCNTGSNSSGNPPPQGHTETITALTGISDWGTLNPNPPIGADGKDVLFPSVKNEAFFAGFSSDAYGDHNNFLLNDSGPENQGVYIPAMLSDVDSTGFKMSLIKNMIALNIDNDPAQELALVYVHTVNNVNKLVLLISDLSDGVYTSTEFIIDETVVNLWEEIEKIDLYPDDPFPTPVTPQRDYRVMLEQMVRSNPSLAAVDIDNDGADELIVGYASLYVVDIVQGIGDEPLTSLVEQYPEYVNALDVTLASGDLNGDGTEEIIIAHDGLLDVLSAPLLMDGAPGAVYIRNVAIDAAVDPEFTKWQGIHALAVGNVDPTRENNDLLVLFRIFSDMNIPLIGDEYGKFVLKGFGLNEDATELLSNQNIQLDYRFFERVDEPRAPLGGYYCSLNTPTLTLLNVDGSGGDYLDEFITGNYLYVWDADSSVVVRKKRVDHSSFNYENYISYTNCETGIDQDYFTNVWVDDHNDDYRDEIYLMLDNNFVNNNIEVMGWDDELNLYRIEPQLTAIRKSSRDKRSSTKVCFANTDYDTPVVRYTGNGRLLLSEPIVLAVLAAPPYYASIDQAMMPMLTEFGTSRGTGEVETSTVGFESGVTVSVGASAGEFSQTSFEYSTKKTYEEIFKTYEENSTVRSVFYATGPDSNKVVFTAIPYDTYYYEVVCGGAEDPRNTDEETEVEVRPGDIMSIGVPRKPVIYHMRVEDYNANNGEYFDIDETVLGHTIGDPWSYARWYDISDYVADEGLASDFLLLGLGGGYTRAGIKVEDIVGYGEYTEEKVTVSAEATFFGFGYGEEDSSSHGYSYEVKNLNETSYMGQIGDFTNYEDYLGNLYGFRLIAYPQTVGEQTFTVVTYSVDSFE